MGLGGVVGVQSHIHEFALRWAIFSPNNEAQVHRGEAQPKAQVWLSQVLDR